MLRIGLMLDSFTASAWIASIVEDIQQSSFAEVSLVVLNTPRNPPKPSLRKRLKDHWKLTLYHRYEQWDYRRNKYEPDAKAEHSLLPLLENARQLTVVPLRKGFSDYFSDEDVASVKAAQLDVIFRFGFRILRGPVLDAARCGIWSFHHDDNREYRGGPPLFWEIYEGNPVSGTILQILTSSLDSGRVIYRGHSATDQRSLYRNRNPIYWKTAQYALRRLYDLDMRGFEYLQSLPTYNEQTPVMEKIYKTPHAGQMVVFLARLLSRAIRAKVSSRLHGGFVQWFLAVRVRSPRRTFDNASGYRILPVPRDRFYADPRLVKQDGTTWLFFEDYRYSEKRALICCARVHPDGSLGKPIEVLRRPYHLSYPYVFELAGQMYMIPETKQNGTVELYRAEMFPERWVLEKVLLENVYAVDATIHKAQGKFWMFAGVSNGKYSNSDELCLFHADTLLGPWQPHRNNPIVSDVRRARPAGALFYANGRLIRPSQDCSRAYGYALCFAEVTELSESDYQEVPIARIEPGWTGGNLGTHTYSRSGEFEVIDGNFATKVRDR